MRIEGSGIYEEIRKVQIKEVKRREENIESLQEETSESAVAQENSRALSSALSNTEFKANLEKIERLKNEIENGSYEPNAENIAKRMMLSEKRGEFYMGLIGS